MRSFGEILTSLREERGIYQKELAAILKVSVGTVSNYENNIHFPDQEALLQLADYFGVTVDYLLGRTSYRYSLDTLNEEYAPGMTVAELVDIIQHFSPQNTASFLDYIELLQLRQKAEDCSSTSWIKTAVPGWPPGRPGNFVSRLLTALPLSDNPADIHMPRSR